MAMRFRAHETFFIRKGWLSKGMKNVAAKPDLFVDHEENPMDILGIGSNMVKALRYWLQAVGITSEPKSGKRLQSFTPLGESIFNNDRYIEEIGTLYLLHYRLASNKEEASAWYYFFNKFSMQEFSKEDFVTLLHNYVLMEGDGEDVALRSLNDDFACIINTYLPRYKANPTRVSPESNIDCPFGELGLVDFSSKSDKTYRKTIPSINTINPWITLAIISDRCGEKDEIGLNELLVGECNIGKIFNLDTLSLLEILHNVEKTGTIKIVRTAGLDVIKVIQHLSFQECVEHYYESIL